MEYQFRTIEFVSPSGHHFTIREQNGEDENILSNPVDVKTLMNLTKFIAAIVVKTDFTSSGKLSISDALELPLLDRYCILIKSRIFSLGETLDIFYKWANGNEVAYEEDLTQFLFEDYGNDPTEDELNSKPQAIPYYPLSETKGIIYQLSTGKIITYDILNGKGEQYIITLPESKQTRNNELVARNLKLQVDGKFETVTNFSCFSVKEMAEIRREIKSHDPIFAGLTELTNPDTGETIQYPILASPTFFYLTEA